MATQHLTYEPYTFKSAEVIAAECSLVQYAQVLGWSDNWERDRESRERPHDLLSNLTDQMRVYKSRMIPIILEQRNSGPMWCTDRFVPSTSAYGIPVTYFPDIPDMSPNWQLKLRLKIRQQSVNLASSCAEYRETGRMFKEMAVAVKDTYRDLKRLRFGKFLSSKRWSKIYLQYIYGIQPLVTSVADAAVKLNAYIGFPPRFVVRTTARETRDWVSDYPFGGTYEIQVHQRASCKALAVLRNEPGRQFLNAGTPLEWAWELIPFSFIVDWGIGVGDWLASLDALRGVQILGTCVTTRQEKAATCVAPLDGTTIVFPGAYYFNSHVRNAGVAIDIPRIMYEPSVTLGRVMSGLALMNSAKPGR